MLARGVIAANDTNDANRREQVMGFRCQVLGRRANVEHPTPNVEQGKLRTMNYELICLTAYRPSGDVASAVFGVSLTR